MSIAITGATVLSGALGQAASTSVSISARLDTLTQQASDGLVADSYAGLGSAASVSLAVAPAIAQNQTWQNDINAASGTMQVAQSALTEISSIASNFYAQTDNLNGLDSSNVDSIAASARDALTQVAGLLDSTDGGVYVFAGQDNANPPIPDPDQIGSSGFFTQIAAATAALGTNGATATIAATLTIASSNATGTSPFSTALSQPAAALNALQTSVATGPGTSVATGILASANANVSSTGTSTTGSYMRDILRALATLGSLSSSQVNTTGFAQVVSDTQTSLGGAITALNQDAGVLGDRQTQLTATQTELGDVNTALQSQLSNAQDVDMASTLSKLTQVQTQLESSYQIIAGVSALSLAKYLTT